MASRKQLQSVASAVRVEALALRHLPAILRRWLPDGEMCDHFWVAGNPCRPAGSRSVLVNPRDGSWKDYFPDFARSATLTLVVCLTVLE